MKWPLFTLFYPFLPPHCQYFTSICHQIFLNFWLLPPIERRRFLWTALQVKLLWTKRSFLPFVLDEGTWVPVFLHSGVDFWRMDGAAIWEFTTGCFISIVLDTDRRTDVWSRDFIIWKINSWQWAVVWAGLWNKRAWADYEQLLRLIF